MYGSNGSTVMLQCMPGSGRGRERTSNKMVGSWSLVLVGNTTSSAKRKAQGWGIWRRNNQKCTSLRLELVFWLSEDIGSMLALLQERGRKTANGKVREQVGRVGCLQTG